MREKVSEEPTVLIYDEIEWPSTGLPTKTEQADLFQATVGRHGECPLPVIAALTPADCFDTAIEAARIATKYMTPVILLSDGYLANGAEPWRIPNLEDLPRIQPKYAPAAKNGDPFMPYKRDENLARPWAVPGTYGLEHRIGGLEKQDGTGNVNYEPQNHQHMTDLRKKKVEDIAGDIPAQEVFGPAKGKLLVLGWGGTAGAIQSACQLAQKKGQDVAFASLRYLYPMPANLGEVVHSYDRVLIPELNMGQLRSIIRSRFLVDAIGLNKVQGRPFMIQEIEQKIDEILSEVKQ